MYFVIFRENGQKTALKMLAKLTLFAVKNSQAFHVENVKINPAGLRIRSHSTSRICQTPQDSTHANGLS